MSRIRQIKPSWFLDKALRRGTSADAREFYIGLWMLADDAGYLVWDTERIGAELYPYDSTAARERRVEAWATQLETLDEATPHLVVWTCGHARVPKMPGHQRIAGKQTLSVKERHLNCRNAVSRREPTVANEPSEPTSATDSPGRVGNGNRNGKVGNGTSRARARGGAAREPSEFDRAIEDAGGVSFRRPVQ
jgi:hypothetical protein